MIDSVDSASIRREEILKQGTASPRGRRGGKLELGCTDSEVTPAGKVLTHDSVHQYHT